MKIDLFKIGSAILTRFNPTPDQIELAKERLEICSTCPSLRGKATEETGNCSLCGCFVKSKAFTPKRNQCPDGKWTIPEHKYIKYKQKKTLI